MVYTHISWFIYHSPGTSFITFIPSLFYLTSLKVTCSKRFENKILRIDGLFRSIVSPISSLTYSSTYFSHQGGLKVIHLSGSIFPALCCWVAFPICEESHSVQYTACLGTTARHSDKSQHRETELYLHSASIHVWSRGFGIEFFFPPSQLSLSLQ